MKFKSLIFFLTQKINSTNQLFKITFFVVCFFLNNTALSQTLLVDEGILLDTTSYIYKTRVNYLKEHYIIALNNAYKIPEVDFKPNAFEINRIKAIAHSELYLADSAIIYANKIVYKGGKEKLEYKMIDPYGVLALNYYKHKEIDSAHKYMELALESINVSNVNEIEAFRFSRKYWFAHIIGLKYSSDRGNNLKKGLIIIIISSVLIISLLVFYLIKKRMKLKMFKKQFEGLQETNSTKKEHPHNINDTTTKRILNDLINIENSTIFLDKDFSLSVLAKLINTNTSYLSRIINDHKQKTFKEYLIDLRIKVLIKNLEENPIMRKYSIEALAESIGYRNASSFGRIFRNHTGINPSEYLKKNYM